MRASEAKRILQEVEAWFEEGVVDDVFRAYMRARYAPREGAAPDPRDALPYLYAAGGLVLGSSALAFTLLIDAGSLTVSNLGISLLLVGALFASRGFAWGDALAIGGFVPMGAAAFQAEHAVFGGGLALAAVALAALRRSTLYVPPPAAIAYGLGTATFLIDAFPESGASLGAWWALALIAAMIALLISSETRGASWEVTLGLLAWGAAAGIAFAVRELEFEYNFEAFLGAYFGTVLVAGGWLKRAGLVHAATLGLHVVAMAFALHLGSRFVDHAGVELLFGIYFLTTLALGIWLRRRVFLVWATVGLPIDAIAFAFHMGGLLPGVAALIAVGIGLVVGAGTLRRFLAATSDAGVTLKRSAPIPGSKRPPG